MGKRIREFTEHAPEGLWHGLNTFPYGIKRHQSALQFRLLPLGNIKASMELSGPSIPERDRLRPRGGAAIHSVHELGAGLRAARKSLGLTQADLALAAGVGLRFVVELEAGKSTVQLGLAMRVIDTLGKSLLLSEGSDGQ